ncbi:MAG: lipoyl(octanoyl) transferase LipB [Bacteroidota bacterium]
MTIIKYTDLGLIDYKIAWEKQKELFADVLESKNNHDKSPLNYLIFCEHKHVYTLGKSGKPDNLLIDDKMLSEKAIDFYQTDRGGDITYHGPGQIVGYPIINLESMKLGVKEYVHLIEDSIILTLKNYDIEAERLDYATGVWIDTNNPLKVRKICAIGVKVSKFITMHGFAFNISTDLNFFSMINPCGFIDKGVTSLEKELGRKVELNDVKKVLLKNISEIFNAKIKLID